MIRKPDWTEPWRRTDFSPRQDPFPGTTLQSEPIGSIRTIVIAKQPHLLAALLRRSCKIKPTGSDWHIEARSYGEQQKIIDLLKLNGVHGILRRRSQAPATPP